MTENQLCLENENLQFINRKHQAIIDKKNRELVNEKEEKRTMTENNKKLEETVKRLELFLNEELETKNGEQRTRLQKHKT